MFRNYLLIALRNLRKYKAYSFINIAGLALGIACCILILMVVVDELSFDRHHKNAANIYRVVTDFKVGNNEIPLAVTSFPIAPALKTDFPEVAESVRLVKWGNPTIKLADEQFTESNFWWADSGFFSVFSADVIAGDLQTALKNPFSVVLTRATAKKYFGKSDAVGQSLTLDNQHELTVTAVIENLPKNSHFQFDLLGSFASLETLAGDETLSIWHAFFQIYTYVLLQNGSDTATIAEKLPAFVDTHMHDEMAATFGRTYGLQLQPLTDIHLHSQRKSELPGGGDILYVYIFAAISLFILLIACINYMNLATARSAHRAKEIGMRKVLGAYRGQLVKQFLGESLLISLLALPVALLIAQLALPFFNDLSGKSLTLDISENFRLILLLSLGSIAVTGLLGGAFPAIVLSSFNPIRTLKTAGFSQSGKGGLRKLLVVFQFSVSIILIACTVLLYQQLQFLRNQKLGLNTEQVITVSANSEGAQSHTDALRNAFLQHTGVQSVASAVFLPGKGILNTPWMKPGSAAEERFEMTTLPVDYDFLAAMDISLTAGRNFSHEFATDTSEAVIINETATKTFGWLQPEDAIGEELEWHGTGTAQVCRVIGVVKDFNFQSLHNPIAPMLILPLERWPGPINFMVVKAQPTDIAPVLAHLESEWGNILPGVPFHYTFLDEDFANLYTNETKLGKIFLIFAALAIIIACLGLFGLGAFSAEQRTKEIGIRKTLGATVPNILVLLSRDFIFLVLVASVVATPLAWWTMNRWLDNFAYKIHIQPLTFVLVAVVALMIALLTVSFQAIKAALANPVKSLKYE